MERKYSWPRLEAFPEKKTDEGRVSRPQHHQVFISFRGAQLRNNFISHLVDALRRDGIDVFIDKQENKGEDISNLLKRIEDSRIAIVVFSSRYTESIWCLKEAEKIMERVAQGKLKVLPVFYKVTPTNVKLLKGEFGDNFRDREWEFRNARSVIKKWKKALAFISGKIGLTLDDQSSESDFTASIVKEVLRFLASIPSATQTAKSHVNHVSGRGESSKSVVKAQPRGGISSAPIARIPSNQRHYQPHMDPSGISNMFICKCRLGPSQSSYGFYSTDHSDTNTRERRS